MLSRASFLPFPKNRKKIPQKLAHPKNGRTFAPAFEKDALKNRKHARRRASKSRKAAAGGKSSEKSFSNFFSKKFGDMEIGVVPLRSQK